MAGVVFQTALSEFLRFKRIAVWGIVALLLYGAARVFTGTGRGGDPSEAYATLSSLLLFRLLPLASAIFSTAVLSQEVEQKTVVYLLTRPIPRPTFLVMRTLASALAVVLVTLLGAFALSLATYHKLVNPIMMRDVLAIIAGAFAYGSLFVLVSLLINRSMIVCLLFAFAWETSIPSMPGSMSLISISTYLTAIAQRPSTTPANSGSPFGAIANALGTNTLRADTGWVVMIGLVLLCMALGAWWFSQNEFLPREDAE